MLRAARYPEVPQKVFRKADAMFDFNQPTIDNTMETSREEKPKIDEVINAMQQADVLLFPTRSEGFGLVAIEAQACGLPVVTTNSSALPEVVQHGKTGFLCDKNDVQSFVDAIRMLKETPDLKTKLSLNARLYTENNFNIDKMVHQYVEVYGTLLKSISSDQI